MLRSVTDQSGTFIFSQQAAATVSGKPDSWLICEGSKFGTLSVIRFNRDGSPDKPVNFALTDAGWELMQAQQQAPWMNPHRTHRMTMYAAHLISLIQKQFPALTLATLIQPKPDKQSRALAYSNYRLDYVTQKVIPVTDRQCFYSEHTIAIKEIPTPRKLFTPAIPATIWFSKSLDKAPAPVPTATVEKELGFIWTETNVTRPYHINELRYQLESLRATALTEVEYMLLNEAIEENRSKIGLVYAGEELGYAVVAMEDIPANTLVTTYTGNLRPHSDIFVDQCLNTRYALTFECQQADILFALDAVDYRNFGAMISHLPSAATIAKYSFQVAELALQPEDGKPDLGVANIRILKYTYRHFPFAVMETSEPIKKGHLLGYDYEMNYWRALGLTPSLFTRAGRPLKTTSYRANKIAVEVLNHAAQRKFIVEATLDTFITNFKSNYGYYVLTLDGTQLAICGNEFLLKHKNNPRCLFLEVADKIDEYNKAMQFHRRYFK